MPKHPFDYHAPSPKQIEQISAVRAGCKALYEILQTIPAGRERSTAITKLEECSMWINKQIIMADGINDRLRAIVTEIPSFTGAHIASPPIHWPVFTGIDLGKGDAEKTDPAAEEAGKSVIFGDDFGLDR